jgi:peptidoglycan-associated lipoprotein
MQMLRWSCPVMIAVISGVACHTRPPTISPATTSTAAPAAPSRPPAPPPPPPPPPAAARPAAVSARISEEELFGRKSLAELNAEQPLADTFFDYDQNTLRDDARAALQKDAAWLSRWTKTAISVEGYCDERGSAEYNLALGERRAMVVKEYLEGLGVSSSRIRTVSLGKEARFCQESNEDCWSKNRRGHLVIIAK